MSRKAAIFEWGLEQQKALQQIQAALSLGLYDLAESLVLDGQFLVCYRVLVETEHLKMGPQAAV